jgi:hypothetical protein
MLLLHFHAPAVVLFVQFTIHFFFCLHWCLGLSSQSGASPQQSMLISFNEHLVYYTQLEVPGGSTSIADSVAVGVVCPTMLGTHCWMYWHM